MAFRSWKVVVVARVKGERKRFYEFRKFVLHVLEFLDEVVVKIERKRVFDSRKRVSKMRVSLGIIEVMREKCGK